MFICSAANILQKLWNYCVFMPSQSLTEVFIRNGHFSCNSALSDLRLCTVFHSLKKGLMLEIRHTIPKNGPFQSYSDIKKYWKNIVSPFIVMKHLCSPAFVITLTCFQLLIIRVGVHFLSPNLPMFDPIWPNPPITSKILTRRDQLMWHSGNARKSSTSLPSPPFYSPPLLSLSPFLFLPVLPPSLQK